jgi:hypothetical protein
MQELGNALKSIFDKISDFFDIFDLSFFVSGVIAFFSLLMWTSSFGYYSNLQLSASQKWIAIILICYVFGLVCFASGRFVRRALTKEKFEQNFKNTLNTHGVDKTNLVCEYISRGNTDRLYWRLYVRLWAEIRQDPLLSPSFSLLKRYWVMAATYDSVGMSFVAWIITVILLIYYHLLTLSVGVFIIFMLLVAVIFCLREARRYENFQIEELVASYSIKICDKQ